MGGLPKGKSDKKSDINHESGVGNFDMEQKLVIGILICSYTQIRSKIGTFLQLFFQGLININLS